MKKERTFYDTSQARVVVVAESDAGPFRAVLTVAQAQRLMTDLSRALINGGVLRGRAIPPPPPCQGKRAYRSEDHARRAHAQAGFRIRPYPCDLGHGWHVSADEKTGRDRGGR